MATMNLAEQNTNNLADQAAKTADKAIKSTQRVTNDTFDRLSGGVQDLRQNVAPILERATGQVNAIARRGVDTVRETAQQLRDRAVRVQDSTVNYIREEPVKAMLIAAAAGVGLATLLSLLTRDR